MTTSNGAVTKTELRKQLREDWARIQTSEQGDTLQHDETRADRLARAEADGLTHREIGDVVELAHSAVTNILRHHRFMVLTQTKIPTDRFVAYWRQVRDPQATRGKRKIDSGYEVKVFNAIADLVRAGKAPL